MILQGWIPATTISCWPFPPPRTPPAPGPGSSSRSTPPGGFSATSRPWASTPRGSTSRRTCLT
ncbi:MAG TPA: hypothetical protein DCM86_05495 [Verrucomicrobiales bacterium]|nr:hypothetical protein [Verrucomicrobiales bacterium]